MTTPDDDDPEMTDQLEYPGDIALLMRELRELGRVPPPAPSPELEALLSQGIPEFRRRRAPRRLAAVAAVVLGATSATGVAAAADRLPGPVADMVNDLTPLRVGDHHPRPGAPLPTRAPRTSTPDRTMHPRPQSSPVGVERRGAPPASEPMAPPDAAPPSNTHDDDGSVAPRSPSSSPSPSPSSSPRSNDDTRSSTGSQTPSPTNSRTARDR